MLRNLTRANANQVFDAGFRNWTQALMDAADRLIPRPQAIPPRPIWELLPADPDRWGDAVLENQ